MKPRLDPRVFLALPLSRTVQARIAAVQDELKQYLADWHFIPPENFHVTLHFFGEVPERTIQQIDEACQQLSPTLFPFQLHWSKLDFFGPPHAGRILFLAADASPELERLADALAARFPSGEARKEFRAHVTLAKARKHMEEENVRTNQNMLRRLREHGRIGPEPFSVDITTIHREYVLMETIWVGRAVEYHARMRYALGQDALDPDAH